jgi:hypothetical protein
MGLNDVRKISDAFDDVANDKTNPILSPETIGNLWNSPMVFQPQQASKAIEIAAHEAMHPQPGDPLTAEQQQDSARQALDNLVKQYPAAAQTAYQELAKDVEDKKDKKDLPDYDKSAPDLQALKDSMAKAGVSIPAIDPDKPVATLGAPSLK